MTKKSYNELLGIYQGYVKMVEVLTAKNKQQLLILKTSGARSNKTSNHKEYVIT